MREDIDFSTAVRLEPRSDSWEKVVARIEAKKRRKTVHFVPQAFFRRCRGKRPARRRSLFHWHEFDRNFHKSSQRNILFGRVYFVVFLPRFRGIGQHIYNRIR